MTLAAFDATIRAHDLNEHPFYKAWREGTLPRERLGLYAAEYARFIGAIERGWRTLGHEAHADEEVAHAGLWRDFQTALGAEAAAALPEVDALVELSGALFGEGSTAVGALYAFEAQQPATARSKLDGLRAHYDLGPRGEAYFERHADDYGERELLASAIAGLDEREVAAALDACERTCRAMWRALDGVLAA